MPEIWLAPSWSEDRHWRKGFEKLSAEQRAVIEKSLQDLVAALEICRHPILDPALAEWRPTRWNAPGRQQAKGQWCEYRLGDEHNKGRAIACYDPKEGRIFLVARTVTHDHERLSALVENFNS